MRRRWWGSRCACAPGGYHVDALLGIDGSLSPRLQEKTCLLAADVSFRKTGELLKSLLDVTLASETIRVYCERNAATMARWKANETDSAKSFAMAQGQWEFAVDVGKVNTLEKGWRDLKIAVVQKRPTGSPATPRGLADSQVTPSLGWDDVGRHSRIDAVSDKLENSARTTLGRRDGRRARPRRRRLVDLEVSGPSLDRL
jgi:hypothetical protein